MNIVEQHKALCLDMNALFAKKNRVYGNSFSETFRKLGIISAVTQITHKYNRLVEIATSDFWNRPKKIIEDVSEDAIEETLEETIEDTLIDLANYALMTVLELRNEKAKAQSSAN